MTTSVLRNIAKSSAGKAHVSTLKWVFGVHKKTSNPAIRGDSGILSTVSGQCQKRRKYHNVDGEIRIQQKCYKNVTKVLQGCNIV